MKYHTVVLQLRNKISIPGQTIILNYGQIRYFYFTVVFKYKLQRENYYLAVHGIRCDFGNFLKLLSIATNYAKLSFVYNTK